MEDEIVAEGVDSGDGANAAMGEAEADPEGILEGENGGVEEEGENVAAFAEDAAQDFGDGEPSRRETSETDWPQARPEGPTERGEGVNTNWRWGTSWQTAVAIHSPMVRVRRW